MPAKTSSRQVFVLAAVLALLAVVVAYEWRDIGRVVAPVRARQARQGSSRATTARDQAASVPDVKLAALRALSAVTLPPERRNPFADQPPPPPAPARTIVQPTGPPPLPPIPLKLVAIVQGAGRPIAALSDGRDVFYGREGEVVEGRYKIVKINVESVDISYVDGRGQRRLGLTG